MLSRVFSIQEIEESPFLRRVYWASLVGFVLGIAYWYRSKFISWDAPNSAFDICPPYLQDCQKFYFWLDWHWLFAKQIFFGIPLLAVFLSALSALYRKWSWAFGFLGLLTFFKLFFVYVLSFWPIVEYEYFHIPVVLMLLFAVGKEQFVRWVFVLAYVLAAAAKLNEAWIVGSYFSSLKMGLPLFPDFLIPYITNLTIIFEIVTPWFFLSRNRKLRWSAVGAWILFHLYSILFVGPWYASYCLSLLLVLMIPEPPKGRVFHFVKGWFGYSLIGVILILNLIPWLLPFDRSLTLQGRRLGIQMFDGNHQCESRQAVVSKDGTHRDWIYVNSGSMSRCAPYPLYFRLKQECLNPNVERVHWEFDSSLNGSPFYQLVNVENVCELSYSEFENNSWIHSDLETAKIVGYPKKNVFGSVVHIGNMSILFPQDESDINLTATQVFLKNNFKIFQLIYGLWWLLTGGYFISLGRKYIS